nr:MAG TPA: hypothetical protein [Caudoviricetes sp.]
MGKRHNIGIVKPPYKCFLSELFTHNKKLQFLSFPATSPQKCSGWVFLFFPSLGLALRRWIYKSPIFNFG